MTIPELINKIDEDIKKGNEALYNADGLLRIQEMYGSYDGEYRLIWSHDLLQEIKTRPIEPRHYLNIDKLDALTGGFGPQQLITISAHTKHGKTAFGLFLMEKLEALSPLMIPLEQSAEELIVQRDDNHQYIPRFLSPRRLASQVTTEWIEQRVVEGIAKYNTKLIVIDHLGFIDDLGENGRYQRENLAYRLGIIVRALKNIAKQWNVTIVLLAHLSQADESKPPSLQDLKGSSSIAQESDLVLMLWRKNTSVKGVRMYENKTLVSVQANRRTGKNGNVALEFDSVRGTYLETASSASWLASLEASYEQSQAADKEFDNLARDNYARDF